MPTISIGNRRPFSISSTRIGVAGWKRFHPLTSASITPSDRHRAWIATMRSKYIRGTQSERADFVWLRNNMVVAPVQRRVVSRIEHHSPVHWSPVTHLHVTAAWRCGTRNFRRKDVVMDAARPRAALRRARHPWSRNTKHQASASLPRLTSEITRQLRVERLRREEQARSVIRTLRIENHRIDRAETQSLARDITFRVQRVEQPPLHRVPLETDTIAATSRYMVREAAPRPRPRETTRIESKPPRPAERPPSAPLNLEAIADSVLRQIDRRLVAQRERTRRP